MIAEIMHSNSVLKLRWILQSRYGVGLNVSSMVDISNIDLTVQSAFRKQGSLHVPIIARGKYLGTAIMDRAELLSESDVNAVSEIVRLVLEPALFSFYLSKQTIIEDETQDHSNVTFISGFQNKKETKDESWYTNRPELSTSVLFLESHNPHRLSRVAIHIHELGSRWALLNWKDVRNEIHELTDIKSMGPMTLVIDDILTLTPKEQSLIADYSLDANPMTEPLILVGGTSHLLDLMDQRLIEEDFGIYLMKNSLNLDRLPTDFTVLKEALELLLDRKAILN